MKTLTTKTETLYVLVTDGKARLVFYSEERANAYAKKSIYGNTTVQKVYSETQLVDVAN